MSDKDNYQGVIDFEPATIASGASESGAIDLNGTSIVGIYTPATMTGTSLSLKAATGEAGTYVQVEDGAGNLLSKTISGAEYVPFNPADTVGVQFVKIVSSGIEGADRSLTLALRQV